MYIDPKITACYVMMLKQAHCIDHASDYAKEAFSAIESYFKYLYPLQSDRYLKCVDVTKILVDRML